jgi:cytochrome c oxidase subunit 2
MNKRLLGFIQAFSFIIAGLMPTSFAIAAHPVPYQVYFQDAVTPVMHQLVDFHDLLLIIITAISAFVLLLLVYVMVRYNEKMNPVPSKTTHNTIIEVIWTAVPVMILLFIAFPSIKLLYYMDSAIEGEMTVKVTGNQWYWTYAYPDHDNFEFESRMIQEQDLKPGQIRLLEVDNRLVLPTNTKIKFIVTASDVLHSWAMPAFGVKRDAVPGRLNETWAQIDKEGVYYGQCSEICGKDHGFMPIAVQAVPKDQFEAWMKKVKDKGDYQEFKAL